MCSSCITCACQITSCTLGFIWHQGPDYLWRLLSASCTESQCTDGRWGQVVNSTACLTLSLGLFVVALGWSHSSLCPPRDQCAYHRQTKRLTVKTIEWSSNVIGLFPYFDLSRDVDRINTVAFQVSLCADFQCVCVYTCTSSVSVCVCV